MRWLERRRRADVKQIKEMAFVALSLQVAVNPCQGCANYGACAYVPELGVSCPLYESEEDES